MQETALPNRFKANEVFSSSDIEDQVSLQAVWCKCSITAADTGCSQKSGNHYYTCGFQYDRDSAQLSLTQAL